MTPAPLPALDHALDFKFSLHSLDRKATFSFRVTNSGFLDAVLAHQLDQFFGFTTVVTQTFP